MSIFFTFLTNYKPSCTYNIKNLNFFKNTTKNKILCRNLFLFLFLIKYYKYHLNNNLWIKPLKSKKLTLLRAPYHNKLSRNQIEIVRYYIFFKLNIKLKNNLVLKNSSHIIHLLSFLKLNNLYIESNIIYQFKIKYVFNIIYKNFFIIK